LSHSGLSTGEVILALRNQLHNRVSRDCSVCSVVQARASGATSGLRVCPRQWTLLGFQPHYTAQISVRQSSIKLRLTVQMAFYCSSEWKSSTGICLKAVHVRGAYAKLCVPVDLSNNGGKRLRRKAHEGSLWSWNGASVCCS
jgi:hypothetical protein